MNTRVGLVLLNAVVTHQAGFAGVYAYRTPDEGAETRTTRIFAPILLQAVKRSLSNKSTKAKAPVERKGLQVGYLRVSAFDQKEVRQLDGVELDKRFTDKVPARIATGPGSDRGSTSFERAIPSSATRWTALPASLTTSGC